MQHNAKEGAFAVSETIRVRLAKLTAALIEKIKRWQAAAVTTTGLALTPGIELMQAQLAQATRALESNSPLGLIKAVEEINEHHTDLGY